MIWEGNLQGACSLQVIPLQLYETSADILQKLTNDRGREKKSREQFILIINFVKNFPEN